MKINNDALTMRDLGLWAVPIVISLALIIFAQYSFLGFHLLAELFTIIISFSLFSFAWWTRELNKNNFFLFLACGYFWIGVLDLLHAMTYKGMNIIIEDSGNISTQFWLSSRFLEAILLLIAPILSSHKRTSYMVFYAYGLLSLVFVLLISSDNFPTSFIEGKGLTLFKITSEYIIGAILALSIFMLFRYKNSLSSAERSLVTLAIIFTMIAEIAFTFYISVYGLSNLVGHIFKLFSFWLIFQAIVVANLKLPYAKLRTSEERFKSLFENSEVSIWEEDLSEVVYQLKALQDKGVEDIHQFLTNNQEVAWELAKKIKVVKVNEATLSLFKAKSQKDFIHNIHESFGSNAIEVFIKSLCAIWANQKSFVSEANYKTFDGDEINTIISYQIPQSIDGFTSVAVNIIDISQQKRNEDLIRYQANFDFLTGIANRNLLFDRLSHALEVAVREKHQVALLFIDLDGFKYINDSKGHEVGDNILKQVSIRLVDSVRHSDTVARLGGDEFAVVLPGRDVTNDIESILKKILSNINEPYHLESIEAYVTASIGVAIFPKDGTNATDLLRKADSAMYKAKVKGANKFQYFTQQMDLDAQQRMSLEQAIRRAIKNKEFSVNYQPVVNIDDRAVTSVEALIRWKSPDLGHVPPVDFIPLAEELGLINDIGEFVLLEACQQAMQWHNTCNSSPSIAINLSSQQFINQQIVQKVQAVLEETGLPAQKLTLEITEGLFMLDEYAPFIQLEQLRDLGIEISIDDFGTGYSSLSYLKRFPLDNLKIDRSFISGLPDDIENGSLIKAILLMAESLGLKVIAEGVETQAQENYLKEVGCQYIQGYLYSKPLPDREFNAWLNHREY